MLVAVTGTPGVGKSAVCAALERMKGFEILEVSRLAEKFECVTGFDRERGSAEVDTEKLDARMRFAKDEGGEDGTTLLDGHLSHLLSPDKVILLRCRPDILEKRLKDRGWSPEKVKENLQAEILDIVKAETMDSSDSVYELDTAEKTPEETAKAIIDALDGRYEPWEARWLEEFDYMLPM